MCNFFHKNTNENTCIINGWEYYDQAIRCPELCGKRPETFFKYYGMSDFSVNALTGLYIYASHPNQFNDPLDCDAKIICIDNEADIRYLWNGLFTQAMQKCGGNIDELMGWSQDVFRTIVYQKQGIFCMTDNPTNEAMWSHYTDNKGFCAEFDISQFPFLTAGPFPINYYDIQEPVCTGKYGIPVAALVQSNIKKKCWESENEWRLLVYPPEGFDMEPFGPEAERFRHIGDHDRKFRYPLSALKSVTLGAKFFDEAIVKPVNDYEIDVEYAHRTNAVKVLDFLSNVQVNIDVKAKYVVHRLLGQLIVMDVLVIKTRELKYRVIELH